MVSQATEQVLREIGRRFKTPDPRATMISPLDYTTAKDCSAVLALIDEMPKDRLATLGQDDAARFRASVAEIRTAVRMWENGDRRVTLGRLRTPWSDRPMTVLTELLRRMAAETRPVAADRKDQLLPKRKAKLYGGRWQIERSLGSGGQADTYLVSDATGTLPGKYVLKRLRNVGRIRRFEREVRAAISLTHPNVVKVVSAEGLGDSRPHFVVEYCSRGHLTVEMLATLDITARLKLFGQVCDALAHAHQAAQPIIHRDIKPENILLREDSSAVVADFGLCYLADENRLTETSEAVGARLYTAPELEDGRAMDVSPACDVYSLGKLLYWMVGERMFAREKHRSAEFDLTQRPPRTVHAQIYELLDRMIVAEPSRRFQAAGEVASVLPSVIRRISMGAHVIDLGVAQECSYCGIGIYQILVDPRWWQYSNEQERLGQLEQAKSALSDFGMSTGFGTPWLVLKCDHCANVQIFRPKRPTWQPAAD